MAITLELARINNIAAKSVTHGTKINYGSMLEDYRLVGWYTLNLNLILNAHKVNFGMKLGLRGP